MLCACCSNRQLLASFIQFIESNLFWIFIILKPVMMNLSTLIDWKSLFTYALGCILLTLILEWYHVCILWFGEKLNSLSVVTYYLGVSLWGQPIAVCTLRVWVYFTYFQLQLSREITLVASKPKTCKRVSLSFLCERW